MDEFLDPSQRQMNQDGYPPESKDGIDILSPDDFYQHRYNMLRKNTRNLINNIDDELAQNEFLNQKKIILKSDTFSPTSNISQSIAATNKKRNAAKLKELN